MACVDVDTDEDGILDCNEILGCTLEEAVNFDPFAAELDDSCVLYGCTFEEACNFNPEATVDDGTCETVTCAGCTDPLSCNLTPKPRSTTEAATSWTSVAYAGGGGIADGLCDCDERGRSLWCAEGGTLVAPTLMHAISTARLVVTTEVANSRLVRDARIRRHATTTPQQRSTTEAV